MLTFYCRLITNQMRRFNVRSNTSGCGHSLYLRSKTHVKFTDDSSIFALPFSKCCSESPVWNYFSFISFSPLNTQYNVKSFLHKKSLMIKLHHILKTSKYCIIPVDHFAVIVKVYLLFLEFPNVE